MNISDFIENKIPESQNLEYKSYNFKNSKFSSLAEKSKNNFVKEITAFANSEGGTIIIGIDEDEHHNPTKTSDVGVNKDTFEMWEQSFRQYISAKIKPVIYNIECRIDQHQGSNLIIITIPKSILKPHAFDDGNKDTFHIRYGNTVNAMRLEELRTAFQSRELLEQRILNFRDERIAKLYSGEQIGELEDKSLLLLHIIPEWSMHLNNYINLKDLKDNYKLDVFSPSREVGSNNRVGQISYNHEGIRIKAEDFSNELMSYTQTFSNGVIESVEIRMMNYSRNGTSTQKISRWDEFEKYLAYKIRELTSVLLDHGIAKPIYFCIFS